jgi:hypothetical protein
LLPTCRGSKVQSQIVAVDAFPHPRFHQRLLNIRTPFRPVLENKGSGLPTSDGDLAYSKFAAQGIRKVAALGWKPLHVVNSNCSSIGGTLAAAGLENSKGLVSAWWEVYRHRSKAAKPAERDGLFGVYEKIHAVGQCGR